MSESIAFITASTEHGTMIVNRLDRCQSGERAWGVGYELLRDGAFSRHEVELGVQLLAHRRRYFGDCVLAIDCGANIGVHTLAWSRAIRGWGDVLSIEAQERIFYALCGNIAINNCFNARAVLAAVADFDGAIHVPSLNYQQEASFGSLELRASSRNEPIGQPVDYRNHRGTPVKALRLDSLDLARVDLIKLDIEGMEEEALNGAQETIAKCAPILLIERIKSSLERLQAFTSAYRYESFGLGMNILAIHKDDPTLRHIKK